MQWFIPVHSVVDVITNSSTSIYTEASRTSVDMAKEIINEVLSAAGITSTADDLFDFNIQVMPEDLVGWLVYDAEESGLDLPDGLNAAIQPFKDSNEYQKRNDAARAWFEKNKEKMYEIFNERGSSDFDEYPRFNKNLVVTTKNGVELKLAEKALRMFDITADYNG